MLKIAYICVHNLVCKHLGSSKISKNLVENLDREFQSVPCDRWSSLAQEKLTAYVYVDNTLYYKFILWELI